ncbi:MAG: glycosyltransferase [Bacteroidaceae bacterium]|nr:glycosyltransferase [Bacteroidaceae bacterium]
MKISIITATFNSAQTIERTFQSVLNQTYKDIEYWVIDGGSTDGTLDVICKYEPVFDGRMHWISEPDKGIYDAMNKGVSRCTGDIIGLLNSDDFYTTKDVLELIATTFSSEIDAIYGDVHFVSVDDEKRVRYYSGRLFRPWMVRLGYMPPHPSLYLRRSVYEKYGLYEANYKISADFEIIARLLYKYKIPYKYVHRDMVTMRMGGVSTQNIRARFVGAEEDLDACKKLGIWTCRPLIYMKFIIKQAQAMFVKR